LRRGILCELRAAPRFATEQGRDVLAVLLKIEPIPGVPADPSVSADTTLASDGAKPGRTVVYLKGASSPL
jgi:hypothetical protein